MELQDGKFGRLDFLCWMLDFGFGYQTFDCGCLIEDGVCLNVDGRF